MAYAANQLQIVDFDDSKFEFETKNRFFAALKCHSLPTNRFDKSPKQHDTNSVTIFPFE